MPARHALLVAATLVSESSCIANVAAPLRVADVRCDAVTGVWTLQLPDGVSGDGLPTAGPPTAGPLLPSLPSGAVLDLEQRRLEGDGNVGYRLWRSAGAMCRWMRRNEGAVRGARVLELGAGTGAVGIFAAALGAREVVLTDGEAGLLPLLASNARRNRPLLSHGTEVTAGRWRFGDDPPACARAGAFDLVLGTDITYSVNTERDALCGTLRRLLEIGPDNGRAARCLIAHEHRRADMFDVEAVLHFANEPAAAWDARDVCLGTFLASAREHGLRVAPLVTEAGRRVQRAPGVVEMTTDLTVFEVSRDELHADPTL